MEQTHLRLHPGESIRSPRILLMAWQGDRLAAHNRFRRLMLFHYLPKQQSRPVAVPVFWQGYDRYNAHPTWPTEAGQRQAAEMAHQVRLRFPLARRGLVPGQFSQRRGQLVLQAQRVSPWVEAGQRRLPRLGLKFIVWFEPERVAAGTQIAREHPEFVFGGSGGGLFKLERPRRPALADRPAGAADRRIRHGLVSQRFQHRSACRFGGRTIRPTARA